MSRMPQKLKLKMPTSKAEDSGAPSRSSVLKGPTGFPYGVKEAVSSGEKSVHEASPYPALVDVDAMISEADISLVVFTIFLC